jgi:hypothetical protein
VGNTSPLPPAPQGIRRAIPCTLHTAMASKISSAIECYIGDRTPSDPGALNAP